MRALKTDKKRFTFDHLKAFAFAAIFHLFFAFFFQIKELGPSKLLPFFSPTHVEVDVKDKASASILNAAKKAEPFPLKIDGPRLDDLLPPISETSIFKMHYEEPDFSDLEYIDFEEFVDFEELDGN